MRVPSPGVLSTSSVPPLVRDDLKQARSRVRLRRPAPLDRFLILDRGALASSASAGDGYKPVRCTPEITNPLFGAAGIHDSGTPRSCGGTS
jgi:hypothetical protein